MILRIPHFVVGKPQITARGFTLLEMLIVLVLSSGILLALFAAVRMGGRAWDSGLARIDASDQLRLVQFAVRRALSQARVVQRVDGDERLPSLSGDGRQLRFVAPMFTEMGRTGLFDVEIRAQGGQLIMLWWPFDKENTFPNAPGDAERTALLDNVAQVRFSYYGVIRDGLNADPDDEAEWHDEWRESAALPELLSLELQWFDDPWPALVVSVHN